MSEQLSLETDADAYTYALAVTGAELEELIAGRVPEAVRLELCELRGRMSDSPAAAIARAEQARQQRETRTA